MPEISLNCYFTFCHSSLPTPAPGFAEERYIQLTKEQLPASALVSFPYGCKHSTGISQGKQNIFGITSRPSEQASPASMIWAMGQE